MSTAVITVLHSAEVVHFTHKSCFPESPGFARPLNTSEVSGEGTLRSLYKDMSRAKQPARVSVAAWSINLPNGQLLTKGSYPKRTGL